MTAHLISLRFFAAFTLVAVPAALVHPVQAQEQAVRSEKNPPGDIPDSQVFVDYTSPLGFSLKVPEGWARREADGGVSFSDKYGTIKVEISQSSEPPSLSGVRAGDAARLVQSNRAVKVTSINEAKLPGGKAIEISFTSNSDPNPVTGKQIRLENQRYLIGRHGQQVALTFSAPAGADNADQWKLMASSFRWP